MTRYILGYGGIAGLLIIVTMIVGIVLGGHGSATASELFGYLVMLVALSLIFVAIKRYRDRALGGVIRFGQALALGMGIAAVAGVAYVVVWEIHLAMTDFAFVKEYTAGLIDAKRTSAASPEELAALEARLAEWASQYAKPWIRLPITFTEIFPVGAIVALISAAVLRKPGVLPA